MANTNLAQDELKAFVRRIESVEDEIIALNADKSEIYKEARSSGFDVKQLRKVVQKRRLPADEREEQDTIFELYWDAVHGDAKPLAHAHVENIEEFHPEAAEVAAQKARLAALRANPAMAVVSASEITKPEPQPSSEASRDLTSPPAPQQGQVATTQPETANDDRSCASVPGGLAKGLQQQATREGEAARPLPPTISDTSADKSAEASASAAPAPKYAEPGVITWETTPPEGVERGAISMAFGTMGQDAAVIADELERGAAQPIIKKGRVILDGWARYMAARNMVELDGSPMAYPVVQYAGDDLLVDIIKLNVEGRMLTEQQKRLVAANLTRQEPSRKDDIYRAFELWMEPV